MAEAAEPPAPTTRPTCEKCLQEFSNGGALKRHRGRKKPCKAVGDIVAARVEEEIGAGAEFPELRRAIWEARNILRRVGVTGKEALDHINALVILRELERIYPQLADPASYHFQVNAYGVIDPRTSAGFRENARLGLTSFSLLAAAPREDGTRYGMHPWHELVAGLANITAVCAGIPPEVSRHVRDEVAPMFTVTDRATAFELVKYVAANVHFAAPAGAGAAAAGDPSASRDLLGAMYMSVVHDFLEGRDLGQHFTPAPVCEFVADALAAGRALGDAFDPTCGSGSILAALARRGAASVSGMEIDARVRKIATAHLMLTTGAFPTGIRHRDAEGRECGDYLRNFLNDAAEAPGGRRAAAARQFDSIGANPPFGIKGVRRRDLTIPGYPESYGCFPMNTTPTGLFLSKIVHDLKVGGRGAVVLPQGRELSSRQATCVNFRRLLFKALDVKMLVSVPSGSFDTTSIKTVVLVFDKVREMHDCMTSVTARVCSLRGDVGDATTRVRFCQLSTDAGGKLTTIAEPVPGVREEVPFADIENNGYSLLFEEYKTLEALAALRSPSRFPYVRLGDLCSMTGGRGSNASMSPGGSYDFYNASYCNPVGKTDAYVFDFDDYLLMVKSGGNSKNLDTNCGLASVWHVHGKTGATSSVLALHGMDPSRVCSLYLAHYLNITAGRTRRECARFMIGTGGISQERLSELEVPLPPIELQRQIAERLDTLEHGAKKMDGAAAALEDLMRCALETAIYEFGHLGYSLAGWGALAPGVKRVQIGDLFRLEKGHVQSSKAVAGEYPFFTGAAEVSSHDRFTHSGESLIYVAFAEGSLGRVHHATAPQYAVSDLCYVLRHKERSVPPDYGYISHYLMMYRKEIVDRFAYGIKRTISTSRLIRVEILLPELETQQRVANQLDAYASGVKTTRLHAEDMRQQMRDMLRRVLMA